MNPIRSILLYNIRVLAIAWILIHQEELKANWQLLQEGEEFFKIEPLR